MVFYQGRRGWRHSTKFADLFPETVRGWRWLPGFEHVLVDQTGVGPEGVAGELKGAHCAVVDDGGVWTSHGSGVEGTQRSKVEAAEGLLRVGVTWDVIEAALGLNETAFRALKERLSASNRSQTE